MSARLGLGLVLCLAGCNWIFPFERTAARDAAVAGDTAPTGEGTLIGDARAITHVTVGQVAAVTELRRLANAHPGA